VTLSSINSFRTKISCKNGMAGPVLKRERWHGTAIDVQTAPTATRSTQGGTTDCKAKKARFVHRAIQNKREYANQAESLQTTLRTAGAAATCAGRNLHDADAEEHEAHRVLVDQERNTVLGGSARA
jgi:hypothetical protein